jgi:hypothetical protein
MTNTTLAGRSFEVDLGPFVPRLTFLAEGKMRLQAQIGPRHRRRSRHGRRRGHLPRCFLVTWTESSGNYIVQLHDHQNGVVHNRARLADGNLFEVEGTIRPVQAQPASANASSCGSMNLASSTSRSNGFIM